MKKEPRTSPWPHWTDVPLLLTVDEVAELWRVNRRTVANYINDGKLAATKPARSWRINREDALAFVSVTLDEPDSLRQALERISEADELAEARRLAVEALGEG